MCDNTRNFLPRMNTTSRWLGSPLLSVPNCDKPPIGRTAFPLEGAELTQSDLLPSTESRMASTSGESRTVQLLLPVGLRPAPALAPPRWDFPVRISMIADYSLTSRNNPKWGGGSSPSPLVRQTATSKPTLIFQILKVILKFMASRIWGCFLLPFRRFKIQIIFAIDHC